MNKSLWKKPAALGLAFTMVLSLTACGGGKGTKGGSSDSSGKNYGDVKNMVFSGTELDMKEVKGDPNSFVVSGDKIYFVATEWPEYDEEMYNDGEASDNDKGISEDGAVEDADSEDTSEGDDSSAEDSSEGTDNKDEETTESEPVGSLEKVGEDMTGLGTAEDSTETPSEEKKDDADTAAEASNEDKETTEAEDTEAGTEASGEGEDAASDDGSLDNGEVTDEMGASVDDVQATTRIYSMNLDCTGVTEVCQPDLENNEYINYLIVGSDGKLMLAISSWDEKTEKQFYFMAALDDSGNIENRVDITKNLGASEDAYVSKILTDDKGNLIVVMEQAVIIMDESFNKTAEVKAENDGWIEGAAKTLDGNIVCGSSGENGAIVQVLDVENKKFGEKYNLDIQYFNSSDALMSGSGEYDFFYKDDKGMYGYSIKDKKTTKIMDYVASEIDSNNSYGIVPLTSDTMIGTSWSEESGKTMITLYSKVDPSEVKDKISITMGSLYGTDDSIRSAAIKFNKENDKYRIEFKDFTDGNFETIEDAQAKVNAEIAAGNIPDIIDLNGLPYQQYVSKGILEDLTPYYDKDDTVKKEDILPSVLKAMEIDGKLYYVAPSFGLNTLVAAKKDVGDKTGWTFDELKQVLQEKGDGIRPFYSENKVDILNNFLYSSVDDYIDWTTGKCRFDSDDFKSILEIAGGGVDEEMDYSEDAPSMPTLIKERKVLLADGSWFEPDNVQLFKKMFNEDISLIGYPCEDKNGSYFSFDTQLGIYSKSEVKDGAWEFIKTIMTKDYQANGGHIWNTPTNKDAFEAYMKTKTATKAYTDEYGNKIEPNDNSWGWDDLEVKIGPLSADEEKIFRDAINNTTKVSESDGAIMNIITEEAKNYFGGQKGLDETADIIQNRVTTYVNENR